jgi:hypothetical protein
MRRVGRPPQASPHPCSEFLPQHRGRHALSARGGEACASSPATKAALEDLPKNYDGVTGKYVKPYSPKDQEAIKESHVLLGRVKNGHVVPAWAY